MAANGSLALPPGNITLNVVNGTTPCSLAASWAAASLKSKDTPVSLTADFVRSILPDAYNGSQYGNTQLVDWWTRTLSPSEVSKATDFAHKTCRADVCRDGGLGFEGDPDIAGVGMMIAYYLAAILGTIYLTAIITARIFTWLEARGSPLFRFVRFINLVCFIDSLDKFVETSQLFSLAMIGAALTRNVSVLTSSETYSAYIVIGSILMTSFSVLHALMLQSISEGLRRYKLRLFLWAAVGILVFALVITYGTLDTRVEDWKARLELPDNRAMRYWSIECDNEGYLMSLEDTMWVAIALLCFNGTACLIMLLRMSNARFDRWFKTQTAERKILGRRLADYKFLLQVANSFACCVMMWLYLAQFHAYRSSVASKLGGSNIDDRWTFGQVLALANWAPVLYDLANVYLYGPEAGLGDHLSSKYKVVRAESMKDDPNSTKTSPSGFITGSFPLQTKTPESKTTQVDPESMWRG